MNFMRSDRADEQFAAFHGRELAGVTFVRHYVQLLFDGPVATLFTMPSVHTSHGRFIPGASGYRNALCSVIGKVVQSTRLRPSEEVRIEFDGGVVITSSLRLEDRWGSEAVMLDDPDTPEVWIG